MELEKTSILGNKVITERITPSKGPQSHSKVKEHFQQYCSCTSIHGLQYLGEEKRPITERAWWLLALLVCLVGNCYLIGKLWIKWNESPVIVSFAETATPVWQVPFPAVTICSEAKTRSTLFSFSEALKSNVTDYDDDVGDTFRKVADVSLLCDSHVVIDDGDKIVDNSTIEFLFEVAPPFDDTIFICKWKGPASQNCSNIFTPILTDEGICFTFNMLSPRDLFRGQGNPYFKDHGMRTQGWTLDNGYPQGSPLDTYPYRALGAGAKDGLTIVMKAMVNDADYICRGPVQGFRVLLHNPAEVPILGERYLMVPLRQEILTVIRPKIMTTSDGLRSYAPSRRQCYFPSERYLKHFKVYTQRNCELECLTNYTLKRCGCAAIHMPRSESDEMCGAGNKECVQEASNELKLIEIESTFSQHTENSCDCLPACTSIQYGTETSQADFDIESVVKSYEENMTEIAGSSMSRVSIFFKDTQFTTSRRSELFGLVDFLANCGGLLGLFSGFSILSLVEIIYFLTLRLWNNTRRKKNNCIDIEADPTKHNNFNSLESPKFVHED